MSIKIENLSYTYAQGSAYEIHALKNLSLEIHDGEFIGIIGHTGSGKSTLIQLLDGLLKADEGHIYYDGEDIYAPGYSLRSLRGRVGLVFQYPEYQLFETTVLKDAAYGPQNQGFSEKEALEKAREALVRVKLSEKYWEMSPFELSGGQKRRAAIAGTNPVSAFSCNGALCHFVAQLDFKLRSVQAAFAVQARNVKLALFLLCTLLDKSGKSLSRTLIL